jgi:hypothetical protein
MTFDEISKYRMVNQKIVNTRFIKANEVVKWMGAMQAQDYAMAKWAIGIRLLNPSDKKIEKAVDDGDILRTHLMRPTWHFVSADDIYWILELTVQRVRASTKSRDRNLELTEAILNKTGRIIEKTLLEKIHVTREELAAEIHKAKIATDNNRMSHILLNAELNGIICSGRSKNGKLTYALLNERVPEKKVLTRDESLAELAKRYFTSHGPATLKDFTWWSGLSVADAKNGLESVKENFFFDTIGDEKYVMPQSFSGKNPEKALLFLLPAYDEFLISYRDRSASLQRINFKRAVSSNGIFYPLIVVNGQVKGLWKRLAKGDKIIIEAEFFLRAGKSDKNLLETEVHRFGEFLNKQTEMKIISRESSVGSHQSSVIIQ